MSFRNPSVVGVFAIFFFLTVVSGVAMMVCGSMFHLKLVMISGIVITILSLVGFFGGYIVWITVYTSPARTPSDISTSALSA
jgi:uncharacterized membrane protein